jgi:hypothetical protein
MSTDGWVGLQVPHKKQVGHRQKLGRRPGRPCCHLPLHGRCAPQGFVFVSRVKRSFCLACRHLPQTHPVTHTCTHPPIRPYPKPVNVMDTIFTAHMCSTLPADIQKRYPLPRAHQCLQRGMQYTCLFFQADPRVVMATQESPCGDAQYMESRHVC